MRISRREFLKGSAHLGAFVALGGHLPDIASAAQQARATANGSGTRYVKSTCAHCVNFCGINVKLENDVIRAIYPDPARAEYYNVGICPKGVAGLFNTYNPYRIKAPLKRTNPKKGLDQDPGWMEISWEEAFNTIAERLKKVRADDPRKLIWQHGHGKYLIGDKFPKAFCKAFGTPNVVSRTTVCEAARHVADELTWGYHGFLPDLEHCNLLLNFGANYFEAEQWARWLDHASTDAHERGMKVVVIEPRMSHTAAKADEWIPIRPGKDVVLLLGMARLLIETGNIDEAFLVDYTNAPNLVDEDGSFLRDADGNPLVWDTASNNAKPYTTDVAAALRGSYNVNGKTLRTAFQTFADSLRELTPEHVAEVTGVPATTVERLAAEMGKQARIGATIVLDGHQLRYRPVAIHTFRGLAAKQYGVQNWRAGLIVQMLLGNIDAVGGINLHSVYKKPGYFLPSEAGYPPNRVDLQESVFFPHATHNVAQQPLLTLLEPKRYGLEYTPEMQIFYATNRPFSVSAAHRQFEGLAKTYNVVIDIVLNETATLADIVLPDLTYLESWHLSPTRYTPTTKHTAIRQPVANAYNLPHDGYSILWELAKRIGIQDDYVANINTQWKLKQYPLQPARDYSAREVVEQLWQEKTKGKGFDYALEHAFVGKKLKPKDTYLKGVEAKFKGPGKPKMHFYAEQLIGTLARVRQQVKDHNIHSIDLDEYALAMAPLPRKEHAFPDPHRLAKGYPFYLITYKRMYRNQSGNTALNPILAMALGPDTDENFVLINRSLAKRRKIGDGDLLVVETRIGKVRGKARLTEGIRPDTVAVSYHYGQQSLDFPASARKGIWINSVLEQHSDPVSGMNSFNDSRCKVYRA
ncbi:MAG: molybdopterin oxidoreductase family protein [Gammaproteobacteria bacterium]|nr:MAG: molybdopterin oxidoreductase family protein [Gammaproteobacteria bacterium]